MKSQITIKLIFIISITFFTYSISYSQLNGIYTIGTGGNYTTIASAVNALVSNGINGPVTFNILTGTYIEEIQIDSVAGTSSVNTITFQSQSGVASDVVWTNQLNFNHLLAINKTDYLKIRNIKFEDSYAFYPMENLIRIYSYSENVTIDENIFELEFEATPICIQAAGIIPNLTVKKNSFFVTFFSDYTNYGVLLSFADNAQIILNKFDGFRNSIYCENCNSLNILRNEINRSMDYENRPSVIGITAVYCNNINLSKNYIYLTASCQYFFGCPSDHTGMSLAYISNALISNNIIRSIIPGRQNFKAMDLVFSDHCKIYYNTFYSSGDAVTISGTEIFFVNNLVAVDNLNSVFIFSDYLNSDHNNFFDVVNHSDNPVLAYFNGSDRFLTQWRTLTNNDLNSRTEEIFFTNILRLTGSSVSNPFLRSIPLSEVTDDIDGDPRDPQNPCMGADEPQSPTDPGLDLTFHIEGFYRPLTDSLISDQVKVSLRSVTSPYNVVDFSNVTLSKEGKTTAQFVNAPHGNYYISVNHRNSIETWSKSGGENFAGLITQFSFSNNQSNTFGNNVKLKGTRYCAYSGDENQDGIIDITDIIDIYNAANIVTQGYVPEDVNGDDIVDIEDIIITFNNSNNIIGVIRP